MSGILLAQQHSMGIRNAKIAPPKDSRTSVRSSGLKPVDEFAEFAEFA